MKRFVPVALAAAAFALPASAATTITITPTPNPCSGDVCSFAISGNTSDANFDASQTFSIPDFGGIAGTVTNIRISNATDIDFSLISLSGPSGSKNFTLTNTEPKSEGELLWMGMAPGTYTLRVVGTSGGNASFGGNLSFAAVPEASTWAFMILGFGLVGGALRRSKARPALRYA